MLNYRLALLAQAHPVDAPDWLWPRDPPLRYRKNVPEQWIELTISEGRNRQVRRMTAIVGLSILLLVRLRIGQHTLEGLEKGECHVC